MQQTNTLINNPAFYAAPLAPKMRGLTQFSVICALHKHVFLCVTMGSLFVREESLEDEILYKICLYRPYLAWVMRPSGCLEQRKEDSPLLHQAVVCDVCNMWLNGSTQLAEHVTGRKHRAAIRRARCARTRHTSCLASIEE